MKVVVISFNWETEETLHTLFEGKECNEKANNWIHKDSFLWKDFPKSEGWTHFLHRDKRIS